MTLVPVSGLVGMMRDFEGIDPEGADELLRLALYEALSDDIDIYGDSIREHVGKSLAKMNDRTRRVLVRSYVSKRERGEEVDAELRAAAALATADVTISKALWDKRKHPRNQRGEFVHLLSGQGDAVARQIEARDAIHGMMRDGLISEGAEVHVHGHDIMSDGLTPTPDRAPPSTVAATRHRANLDRTLAGTGIAPDEIRVGQNQTPVPRGNRGVLFDLTSRLAGERIGLKASQGAPVQDRSQFHEALDNIMSTAPDKDRRAYRRMNAVGGALRQVSNPNTPVHAAGQVAQLVGQLGPEAEKVLSSPIRRTAYRYRGTEKRPDPELVREVDHAADSADNVANGNSDVIREQVGRGNAGLGTGTAAYYTGIGENRSGISERGVDPHSDQLDLRLRGDTAVGYFQRKLISPDQYVLSIEAGKVPPSQGAIINANGDVTSEAMGYGEDHYLPFDLKNLKALNGGQYVRTRATGGPTSEDIYTGLLTGARQIQVVSNSGIFTVEFDPDLRGGRRYNDKARQMVGRYEKLLGTVEQGEHKGLYTNDISESQKASIRAKAYEDANYHEGTAKELLRQRLQSARLAAAFGPEAAMGDDEIREQAENQARKELRGQGAGRSLERLEGMVQSRADEIERDMQNEQRDKQVRALRLDGVGYNRALRSLQQEFPYYIRAVDFESNKDFDRLRRHTPGGSPRPAPRSSPRTPDKGYLAPGQLTSADTRGPRPDASGGLAGGRDPRTGAPVEPSVRESEQATTVRSGRGGARGELANLALPNVTTGPKLSELGADQGGLEQNAVNAVDEVLGAAETDPVPAGAQLSQQDFDNPDGVTNSMQYARAILLGKGREHLGSVMKPGADKQRKRLLAAIDEMDRYLDAGTRDGTDPDGHVRAQYSKAKMDAARKALKMVDAAGKPWSEPAEDPALFAPTDPEAPPQRFDDVDKLGVDPANYDAVGEQLQRSAPLTFKAVNELASAGSSSKDWSRYVGQKVRAYADTVKWGQGDFSDRPPVGSAVPSGMSWGRANEIAEAGQSSPAYRQLLAYQHAWALLHGQEIADSLSGGGAGPKAAASPPAGGSHAPKFTSPGEDEDPDPEALHKRAPRRIVLHPPGSPVAKAAEALARSTSARRAARR